jgi:hypothetical protein
MTYAEAVNSLESYLQNIDSAISFESWMDAVSDHISKIYGNDSFQQVNFRSLKNDFASSKTGLTDPVKYRINEKNFRLRAKSHVASLISGLKEAEQLAIREAQLKKKEAEEKRLREKREAEEKRIEEERKVKNLKEQLREASSEKQQEAQKKRFPAGKAILWIVAPLIALALFYGGYMTGSTKENKEKLRLLNENSALKKNNSVLLDSLEQQKHIVNQPIDSLPVK